MNFSCVSMRKYHAAGAHRGIFELNKTHEYLFKNNQEYTKIKYFALLLITIMKIRKVFLYSSVILCGSVLSQPNFDIP